MRNTNSKGAPVFTPSTARVRQIVSALILTAAAVFGIGGISATPASAGTVAISGVSATGTLTRCTTSYISYCGTGSVTDTRSDGYCAVVVDDVGSTLAYSCRTGATVRFNKVQIQSEARVLSACRGWPNAFPTSNATNCGRLATA
jgi:hypothetical protein